MNNNKIVILAEKIVSELNLKGAGLGTVSNMIVEQVLKDAVYTEGVKDE